MRLAEEVAAASLSQTAAKIERDLGLMEDYVKTKQELANRQARVNFESDIVRRSLPHAGIPGRQVSERAL